MSECAAWQARVSNYLSVNAYDHEGCTAVDMATGFSVERAGWPKKWEQVPLACLFLLLSSSMSLASLLAATSFQQYLYSGGKRWAYLAGAAFGGDM